MEFDPRHKHNGHCGDSHKGETGMLTITLSREDWLFIFDATRSARSREAIDLSSRFKDRRQAAIVSHKHAQDVVDRLVAEFDKKIP